MLPDNCKLRLLYKFPLLLLLMLAGVIITGLIFPVVHGLLQQTQAEQICNQLKIRWLQIFAWILNLKVNKQGQAIDAAALFAGNHISWLDILVLGQFVPGYFVAKSDIAHWPVFGFIATHVGAIFIQRGKKQHIKVAAAKMVERLQQQHKVFVFPEATTSDGKQLLAFHSSLLQPAFTTQSPIQPFAIQYTGATEMVAPYIDNEVFMPHLLRLLAWKEIPANLTILKTISSQGKTRQEASTLARTKIQQVLYDG